MDLLNFPITTNSLVMMLGAFFLLVALLQLFRLLNLSRKGIKVNATIKELIEIRQAHGARVFNPVLEYKTENGETITKRSYISKDILHQQKVGETVTIVYNPDKPDQFLMEKGMDRYWKVIGSIIAGGVFIAAGLLKLF
jgi:hypothetical protein